MEESIEECELYQEFRKQERAYNKNAAKNKLKEVDDDKYTHYSIIVNETNVANSTLCQPSTWIRGAFEQEWKDDHGQVIEKDRLLNALTDKFEKPPMRTMHYTLL